MVQELFLLLKIEELNRKKVDGKVLIMSHKSKLNSDLGIDWEQARSDVVPQESWRSLNISGKLLPKNIK